MSRNALLLLATGRDRPGIVDRLTGLIYEAGGNLEDSRMAILGGEFALIVLVTGSPADLEKVERELPRLAKELELTLQVKKTVAGPEARRGAAPSLCYRIHAVAMDHPGIVHKVTRVLAEHGVNVAKLDTSLANAPVSGAPVFSLDIEAEVPVDLPLVALRGQLERLAEAENIDLDVRVVR
jgi:glycine cleavage system transcriptional repressor